jgi:hypothetical protein
MRRPPAITIAPFAGACSGALSKTTCESATTIAGTTTKATQISFEEIPASRPAQVASICTAYLEPERRGWPAAGGLGATGVAQQKKANVRGSTTGCSHRTRSPIVIKDPSIVLVVFVAGDDQFRGDRDLLGCLVANHDTQARAWSKGGRERGCSPVPVFVLALERYARDVQGAFTDVAGGDGSFGAAAGLDAAETERAG